MGIDKEGKIECIACEAIYTITFEDLSDYYNPTYCAFCGEELEHKEELSFENPDDIEEE